MKNVRKMILWSFLIFFLMMCFPLTSYATENEEETLSQEDLLESQMDELKISDFLQQGKQYTEEVYGEIDFQEVLTNAFSGKINHEEIFQGIFQQVGKEGLENVTLILNILIIIIIHSILRSFTEGLENKGIGKVAYFTQYILIATIILTSFTQIIEMVKDSIENLTGFMNCLIPILITLLVTTGSFASAGMLEPVLLFLITLIGNLMNAVILPLILASTVLILVSNLGKQVQVDKLAKFFHSSVIWILGVVLTLFVGVVSLEGSLTSNVDGITAKTTKAAVSSFVPVVGKILGDAVDTVIGCSSILKNAVGIIGFIVILGICIGPIIKLTIMMALYYLTAAVCQPIADEKIIHILEQMGGTFKVLLAILCSISVMLIIGVALVMKISNAGLMYR